MEEVTTSEAIAAALKRLDIARTKTGQYQQAFENQKERERTLRKEIVALEVLGQAKTPPHTTATRDAQEAKNSAAKYRVLLDTAHSEVCGLELVLRELRAKLQVEERQAKREAAARLVKLADKKASYLKECVEPLAWALASTAASEHMSVEFYQLNELVTNPVNSITRDVKTRAAAIYASIASGERHV